MALMLPMVRSVLPPMGLAEIVEAYTKPWMLVLTHKQVRCIVRGVEPRPLVFTFLADEWTRFQHLAALLPELRVNVCESHQGWTPCAVPATAFISACVIVMADPDSEARRLVEEVRNQEVIDGMSRSVVSHYSK